MLSASIITKRARNNKCAMHNVPVTDSLRDCLIHSPQNSTDSTRWTGVYPAEFSRLLCTMSYTVATASWRIYAVALEVLRCVALVPVKATAQWLPFCSSSVNEPPKWSHDNKQCAPDTDIEGRSQNPYSTPCNGVVSHGAPIGRIQVFAEHTRRNKCKKNASMTFARRAAFHTFLSLSSDHSTYALTNHGYFDRGKYRIPPTEAPCRDNDGAGSGISGLYLWLHSKCEIHSRNYI